MEDVMSKHCHERQSETLSFITWPRRLAVALLFLMLLPLGALRVAAEEIVGSVRGAGPGERVLAPDLKSSAELVTLDANLTPRLLGLAPEASLRVTDWPVAPETRRDVILTRHEIYAPDAKIYRVDDKGLTELPRSTIALYWGVAEGDDQVRVFLAIDPATGKTQSFTQLPGGLYELRPVPGKAGQNLVAAPEALGVGDGSAAETSATSATSATPHWSCGEEEALQDPTHTSKALRSILGGSANTAPPFTDLHTATVAIDTDNELLTNKFANSTVSATSYIASLLGAMTVMYERDLHVRLLQGTTFLRVSSTPDPWNQASTGGASGAQLSEVSSYWAANYGNVSRAVTVMLSGKGSTNSASGIAWISGLCSASYGYSFSQVFLMSYLTGDASVVGHEIGHNFGSPHTHCYSPPADNCFNGEGGCYSGGTSCPAPQTINGVTGVTGTLMSYCQLFGGCGTSLVFHPRSLTEYINAAMANAKNVCLLPASTAPVVTGITPKSGTTSGGTPIVITGSNFQAGATVSLGGVPATGVVVTGSTITAISGAHATGTVAVTVSNLGASSGTLSNGYFYNSPSGALGYYTVPPCRLVDTRNPVGPLGGPALGPSSLRTFTAIGHCGIPNGTKSIAVNISVTGQAVPGFLSFYAGNAFPFGTTTLNFTATQTRTNNAIFQLSTDGVGTFGVQNGATGSANVIIDVTGYFK
jgi:hypothetical protein